MVVSAEKARQKAEARRQRILAKSAERMDVVSGLAPKGGGGTNDDDDEEPATVRVNSVVEEVVADDNPVESSVVVVENDNIPSSSSGGGGGGGGASKGARRMAAMRRRRYQNKKKEADQPSNDNEGKAHDGAVVTKDAAEEKGDKESSSEPITLQQEEEPPAAESTEEESPSSLSSSEEPKKKYMGVARMRRRIIKEEKAKRIAELEAASDPIDAAATMATLGMTASMIREGSGSVVGEVDLSEVAIKTLRGKKKWWKLLFPPMSLVPRLFSLMLLFMAGLDVGLEPHRMKNATDIAGGMNGGSGENLIYHVESSFTKPWEYGMGGKARHMMGMKDAAPPTAMPTSFSREGFCVSGNIGDDGECVILPTSNEKERSGKEKFMSKLMSKMNEDEFADISLPKGVATSEFDDDEETYSAPVIDPIFQVDLDYLLQNSQLPAPINFAAKFAIGFHRMWVRYLWTVPTSMLKSILHSPKSLVTSWMANPPVFLFISLLIRLIGKVLVGKTPSFSEEENENNQGKKSDSMDILGKLKDTALNYATSSFPKTILVLKTLKEVVTVDMYVILYGLLVGLVTPLVKQDLGFGSGKVLGDGEL